ncbi:ParM/StbA family protein [Bacillus paranthracis]|uniref:ParM/StbA family protein n=1 Tax=Bacillus paranthracis TaxID=2026186 RepID=UPI003D652253
MTLNLILGVDAGLNAVKIVGPKGEGSFPSITIIEPSNLKKFGNALQIQNRFELGVNGESWILGEHAQFIETFNPIGIDSHSSTGSKNDETAFVRALGGICLYMDKYEKFDDEDINVYLAYGTPLTSASEAEEIEQIEARFKNNGNPIEVVFNDVHLNIRIKDIIVLPEGAAAFFSNEFTSSNVYVVDAGSQTINLAAFVNGILVPTGADTIANGVEFFKNTYDNRAAEMIARTVKGKIESLKWPKDATLHVCGGYSEQLAAAFNELKDSKYQMEIMKPELALSRKSKSLKPVYANAAGLYFIAKEAFATAVKG